MSFVKKVSFDPSQLSYNSHYIMDPTGVRCSNSDNYITSR